MVNVNDTIELENVEEISNNLTHLKIEYVKDSISYSAFFKNIMLNNLPCIIKLSPENSWESTKEWVCDDCPNFEYMKNLFGSASVPVANCGEKYYNVQKKCPTRFSEYLEYWKKYIAAGYPPDMPCLYLKDWHFTKEFPERNIYRVPKFFASDWLNEFLTSKDDFDDYRFVYMGPQGSWTPLHADVFTSYSWSFNVCGQKRWLLFPSGQEKYLKDKHGNLIYDATSPDLLDSGVYPDRLKLTPFDVIQEAGEAIFVPTGWHHQVWNLKDTISINHNWINGCNVEKVWQSMKCNLIDIKKEIEDCRDMENWHDHCQIMLQSLFGMNYSEFFKFLQFIAHRRLESANNLTPLTLYGNWQQGIQHTLFDLQQIKNLLENCMSDEDVQKVLLHEESRKNLQDTLSSIEETLEKLTKSDC